MSDAMEGKRLPAASEPTFVLEDADLEPPATPAPRSGLGVWRSFLIGAAKSAKSPAKASKKPIAKAKAVEPERPKRVSEPPKKRVKPILDSRGTIRAGAPVPVKRVKVAKKRNSEPPPPPRPQQDSAEEVRPEELWIVERTVTLTGADVPAVLVKPPLVDEDAIDTTELGGMIAELRMAASVPPPPMVPRDLAPPPPLPPVIVEPPPLPAPAPAPAAALDSTHKLSWAPGDTTPPVAISVASTIPPPARPRKRSPLMSVGLVMFVFAFVAVAALYGQPMLRSMTTAAVVAPVQKAPALPEPEAPAVLSVVNRETPAMPNTISITTATTITTATATTTTTGTATEKTRPLPKRSTAVALQHAAPPPPPRPRATAAPAPAPVPAPKPAQTTQEADEAKQDLGRAKDVIDTTLQ